MFLVYGLQKTGISIIKLLQKKNQKFKIWDDNEKTRNYLKNKFNQKIFFNPKTDKLNSFKKIYISSGISIRQKKFNTNNILSKLNRDLNLYVSNLGNTNVIAVTGTNGKSTTTKIIGDILEKNNIKTFIGGNIGKPLCNALITNNKFNFHVIELSSFQLETIENLDVKISIITNLANDHLDRYKDINDYINQKKKILTKTGINLISLDDKYSRKIFKQKKIKNKISFSIYDKSANIYMSKNYILDNYFKKNRKVFIKNISKDLEGDFNNQNIVISYICHKLLKLSDQKFLSVIKNYVGLPFRSNIIFKSKKLKIINNSKSTNINSTINSIKNYNNIYLILGGIAKEKNFEIISKYKPKIKYVYVYGESANYIEKKLNKFLSIKRFDNLKILISQIFKDIQADELSSNILFAPACTSYDQYENFEQRGRDFNKLINQQLKKYEIYL